MKDNHLWNKGESLRTAFSYICMMVSVLSSNVFSYILKNLKVNRFLYSDI